MEAKIAYKYKLIPRFINVREDINGETFIETEIKERKVYSIYEGTYNLDIEKFKFNKTLRKIELDSIPIVDGVKYTYYYDKGIYTEKDVESDQKAIKVGINYTTEILPEVLSKIPIKELDLFIKETKFKFNDNELPILYVLFNLKRKKPKDRLELLILSDFVKKYDYKDLESVFNLSNKYIGELNEEIYEFLSKYELNSIEKYKTLKVKQTQTVLKLECKVNFDLHEIFDNIVLNNTIPFASLGEYYKILDNFKPFPKWIKSKEDIINMKIYDGGSIKENSYFDIYIKFRLNPSSIPNTDVRRSKARVLKKKKEEIEDLLDIYIETKLSDDEDIIIKQVKECVSIKDKTIKTVYKIQAEFIIPEASIDIPIFAYLILTDPLFSDKLFIDERIKTTKKRTSQIFLHYYPDDENFVSVSITEDIVDTAMTKRMEDLKEGDSYIKINITRAKDMEDAYKFRDLFSKFMTVYDDKKREIVDFYVSYIGEEFTEGLKSLKKVSKSKKFVDKVRLDPNIFIASYPRNVCDSKRQPVALDEKEEIEQEDRGSYGIKIPGDKSGRTYGCTGDIYIYPGLKENKTDNNNLYPCLPCCFQSDQRNTKKFKDCLKGVVEQKKGTKGRELITLKLLSEGQIGILPSNIYQLLYSLNFDGDYKREGVGGDPSSIIYCILKATNKEFMNMKNIDKQNMVREVRLSLLNELEMCIQNSIEVNGRSYFYHTQDELRRIIISDEFLDAKIFLCLLEQKFKHKIYLFTWNEDYKKGIMISPLFLKFFISFKSGKDWDCILIHENMGEELDKPLYPHYELIIKETEHPYTLSRIVTDISVIMKLNNIFYSMFSRNSKDLTFELDIFKNKIIGQGIDAYGKTRYLQFKNLCILTDPIPSYPIKLEYKYEPVNELVARKFCEDEKLEINEIIYENKLIGISTKKQFGIYIPIIPVFKTGNTNDIKYPTFLLKQSEMDKFIYYQRLSRVLPEYFFYIFSKYLHESKMRSVSKEFIRKFIDEKVRVDENFKYGEFKRTLDLTNGLFNDNKLIIPDKEVLKRLIYMLTVRLNNKMTDTIEFYKRTYIENYYMNTSDFINHKNQVILYGENSLMQWISSISPSYVAKPDIQTVPAKTIFIKKARKSKKIKVLLKEELKAKEEEKALNQKRVIDKLLKHHINIIPYFIFNELLNVENTKIYLVQTTNNLKNSIYVSQYWLNNKKNIGKSIDEVSTYKDFCLVDYNSAVDIDITVFKNNKMYSNSSIDIFIPIILRYKKEEIVYYQSLLPI